eukprot:366348-Chlamydomonas_euryale.AAC.4
MWPGGGRKEAGEAEKLMSTQPHGELASMQLHAELASMWPHAELASMQLHAELASMQLHAEQATRQDVRMYPRHELSGAQGREGGARSVTEVYGRAEVTATATATAQHSQHVQASSDNAGALAATA